MLDIATERELKLELARIDFYSYCKLKAPAFYNNAPYLRELCDAMQDFLTDDNQLLVINMPPRFGKSRTAGEFAQWALGDNNKLKIITASYNEKLSRTFSKSVRNAIQEQKADVNRVVYSDVFPLTRIERGSGSVDLWKLEGSETNNYLATAPNATVTGFGADVLIIDDVIKNAYEANHQGILEGHFEWFTNTMYSRLEGRAKVILIMTRWSTKDLAGRLMKLYDENNRKYKLVVKKAFEKGKPLNPDILDKKRYDDLVNTIGADIVQANYNQEPMDLVGFLYGEFKTYKTMPNEIGKIKSMCDTADTGSDFLCNIIYKEIGKIAYVIDIYYTQENIDITERELPKRLVENKVDWFMSESNFGGSAFRKIIKAGCIALGKEDMIFKGFSQTQNKEARIYSNSTNVIRQIIMPERWERTWPKFYKDVTEFQRNGENAHDDGPDTLTMIVERIK